jgi:hypothetical protein
MLNSKKFSIKYFFYINFFIFIFLIITDLFVFNNRLLVWGEHYTSIDPKLNLDDLFNHLSLEEPLFLRAEYLARGYHFGLITNVVNYCFLYLSKFFFLNPSLFQILINFFFKSLAIFHFYTFFAKNPNFKQYLLLCFVFIFPVHHFSFLFSGISPLISDGLFMYFLSIIFLRLNKYFFLNKISRIFFIFLFVSLFYLNPTQYLIYGFSILFVHYISYYLYKNFLNKELVVDYLIISLLCSPLIIESLLYPMWPVAFGHRGFFFLLSGGFLLEYKGLYGLIFNIIVVVIIFSPLLFFYKTKIIRIITYLIFLFVILGSTKIIFYLKDYIFFLENFRSAWRFNSLIILLILFGYLLSLNKLKNLNMFLILIISINLLLNYNFFKDKINLITIPQDYIDVSKELSKDHSKKIVIPPSSRYNTIWDNYKFYNTKNKHTYYSSLFGVLVPVNNLIDLDLSEHFSKEKYQVLSILKYDSKPYERIKDLCIKTIILENEKESYFKFPEINKDIFHLKKKGQFLNIYEINHTEKELQKNCLNANKPYDLKSYLDMLKKRGSFAKNNKKIFDYTLVNKPIYHEIIMKEKIYKYKPLQAGKLKKKKCINLNKKEDFVIFRDYKFDNTLYYNSSIPTYAIKPIGSYFEIKNFESFGNNKTIYKFIYKINDKGKYCFAKQEPDGFLFYLKKN